MPPAWNASTRCGEPSNHGLITNMCSSSTTACTGGRPRLARFAVERSDTPRKLRQRIDPHRRNPVGFRVVPWSPRGPRTEQRPPAVDDPFVGGTQVAKGGRVSGASGIRVWQACVDDCLKVGAELIRVDVRRLRRHGRESLACHRPPATQRDQLTDRGAVAGDYECLAMLDSIHNLPGFAAEISLRDLMFHSHTSIVPRASHLVLPRAI